MIHSVHSSSSDSRSVYWDNIKGILIALVVFGHFIWDYQDERTIRIILYTIYTFHMPAFILVSGYFSKSDRSVHPRSLLKIFLIFIVFNISLMLFGSAVDGTPLSATYAFSSSWYLLALFLYRLTVPILRSVPLIWPFIILLSLSIGEVAFLDWAWQLQKIITLYPFFVLGYKLPSLDKTKSFLVSFRSRMWLGGFVFLLATCVTVIIIAQGLITQHEILWLSYTADSGALDRLLTVVCGFGIGIGLFLLTPSVSLPFLTQWGRNSLAIYLVHRFPTMIPVLFFPHLADSFSGLVILILLSFFTLLLLGTHKVSYEISRFVDLLTNLVSGSTSEKKFSGRLLRLGVTGSLILGLLAGYEFRQRTEPFSPPMPPVQSVRVFSDVMSSAQARTLEKAVSIAFVGDFILLRNQVQRAYDPSTDRHDFSSLFQYTSSYFQDADFALGVLEGPLAGPDIEYSTSNFGDGIPLFLNFPDSFARSIKDSGIDMVTTANNHFLDRGVDGMRRTLDVLDDLGLAHIGTFRNAQEKMNNQIRLVTVRGLKIALLAYTYGQNYHEDSFFEQEENAFMSSFLAHPWSPFFERRKSAVLEDFRRAKEINPDAIIVLPHMGQMFTHVPDHYQKVWMDIFIEAGADVVFSTHTHTVQPVEWRRVDRVDRDYALIVYSSSHYVNAYTDFNGDAQALVEAYLDPETGAPRAAGIVPMWGQSMMNGLYRSLPIYKILHDGDLQKEISTHDIKRVREVQTLITQVMLGRPLTLDQSEVRHYLFPSGLVRAPVEPLTLSHDHKNTALVHLLRSVSSVCFIGDSITEGTKNGGYGWYEPLSGAFPDLTVYKRAWGGHTIRMLLDRKDEILDVSADVYVIAVGTNDVRYQDPEHSSLTSVDYVHNIDRLTQSIREKNPSAQFVFIGAWTSDHYDPVSVLDEPERMDTLEAYREALKEYARAHGFLYIDPNPRINQVIFKQDTGRYLVDHIHPNAGAGIRLYAQMVLESSPTLPDSPIEER